MPARITTAIPPRSYELVRDNVGRILATEILEQFTITSDQLFNTPVYIQRSKPVQPSETSLVIVSVGSGAFDNQTVIDSDGTLPIFIDCFCTSAGTDDDRGDVLSSYKVQRLAGVVMAILEHPEYKTLDFAPPFIMGSHVGSFETGTLNKEDSTNTSVVRIVLNVRASQNEPEGIAIPIASTGTQVTLGLTDLGYAWGSDMPPLPPPICSPVRIYNTNTTYDVTIASGGFLELPNTPVEIVDSFGTVLGSGDIPSVTGGNIVISTSCADATAILKDVDGNTISSTDISSGQTVDITAPNGTVTATNSLATTIGSTTVLSNGTANIPISDSAITLNSSAFLSVPAENSQNIILIDQDDNVITPLSLSGDTIKVDIPEQQWWTRNPDWVEIPTVSLGDDVFYGVVAVYEDTPDFNSVYLGGFTVLDWGDGASGGTSHAYNYATLTSTIIIDKDGRNYKTALVYGVTSAGYLNLKASVNDHFFYNWLEVVADIPNINTVNLSSAVFGRSACYLPLLERVTLTNTGNFSTCSFGMDYMPNLKVFDADLTNITTAGYFLMNCSEVRNLDGSVINWNLPNCTAFNSSFNFNTSSLGIINLPLVPNLSSVVRDVKSLIDVKIITSPTLTDLTAFGYQSFIRSVEITNCTGVTNASLFLSNNSYLQRLILNGMTIGFSVSGQMMSATALNEMFTSLGIASGTQTINVSNNKGSATCDTSIATSKGFTVII